MSLADVTGDLLETLGEVWTIRKSTFAAGANTWTAGTETVRFYLQKAQRRVDRPNDAGGLVRDAQAVLIMSPRYCEPCRDDRVARGAHVRDEGVEWFDIVHVDEVYVEGHLAKYYAWVRS